MSLYHKSVKWGGIFTHHEIVKWRGMFSYYQRVIGVGCVTHLEIVNGDGMYLYHKRVKGGRRVTHHEIKKGRRTCGVSVVVVCNSIPVVHLETKIINDSGVWLEIWVNDNMHTRAASCPLPLHLRSWVYHGLSSKALARLSASIYILVDTPRDAMFQ